MLILALDTAMSACSVCLLEQNKTHSKPLATRFELMQRGQSEALMPMISAVMNDAGLPLADIDLIAVTKGPGAFTGLRIGLAAARGLALALNRPCLGLTTTEAVAEGVYDLSGNDLLVVALDTKRADTYIQIFKAQPSGSASDLKAPIPLGPPCALPQALIQNHVENAGGSVGNIFVVGDAAEQTHKLLKEGGLNAQLSIASSYPDPVKIGTLALRQWAETQKELSQENISQKQTGCFNLAKQPAPLYLRPPDAIIPKNGGRLRP